MSKPQNLITAPHYTTLVVGIQAPYNKTQLIQTYYDEFFNLLKTAQVHFDHVHLMKLNALDPKTFLTSGKLEELRLLCQKYQVLEVYFSEPLTAKQARHLEDYLNCEIFDRTDLILKIFKQAAVSGEGKMQVEIAELEHKKTRLAGKGIHLSQQRGGIGVKAGAGETLKEKERRAIENIIARIRRQLVQLQQVRATQRKQRVSSGVPHFCLIGYTNAGKSTILNTLTHANVLAQDKLFATLDTTTRELFIDDKKRGVLSDTVGFIQYLPHQLIEAFKSTLSELQYADILLQVIDASDPDWQAHIGVVHEILNELEVQKPIVYVFNKIDKLSSEARAQLEHDAQGFIPHVFVSATDKKSIQPLIDYLAQ